MMSRIVLWVCSIKPLWRIESSESDINATRLSVAKYFGYQPVSEKWAEEELYGTKVYRIQTHRCNDYPTPRSLYLVKKLLKCIFANFTLNFTHVFRDFSTSERPFSAASGCRGYEFQHHIQHISWSVPYAWSDVKTEMNKLSIPVNFFPLWRTHTNRTPGS